MDRGIVYLALIVALGVCIAGSIHSMLVAAGV